jgi:protein O-mannosyl-transferase
MWKKLYALLVIVSAGLIAYSATFTVPFQFDDYPNIAHNPLLKNLGNFFLSSKGYSYNPRRFVGYLTLALNYHFGGLDVVGYHLVNLAIHLINGILVYFLVILTFKTPYFTIGNGPEAVDTACGSQVPGPGSRSFIALFAALLFVAHPIQTQAVTYIVQRFTSMAAMFYLLSIIFYIKGRLGAMGDGQWAMGNTPPSSSLKLRGDRGGLRFTVHDSVAYSLLPIAYYLLALLSAVLAMKTKEIAFTLPVMIVLYEFFFFKAPLKKKLIFLLPVLLTLVIIPVSVMGTHRPLGELLSDLSARTRVQTNIPRWDYLMTQLRVITTYIRLLFLPVNQNLDYDYPIYRSLSEPPVIVSFLFLLSLFGMAVYFFYRSRQADDGEGEPQRESGALSHSPIAYCPLPIASYYRLISFGIFWFFITLSVESSVIPIADVIFEHRVYLPSVGAFIAIAGGASVIAAKSENRSARRTMVVACAAILLFLSAGTYTRNLVWRNEVRLLKDVVRKSPHKLRPHYDLGLAYENQGQIGAAFHEYQIALQIDPHDSETLNNIGGIYFQQGLIDDALKEYRRALRYAHGSSTAHFNAGNAYFALGRLDDAVREYQAALRLNPDDAAAHNNLGGVYLEQGLLDEALREIQSALKIDPEYEEARTNLAKVVKMREQGYFRPDN